MRINSILWAVVAWLAIGGTASYAQEDSAHINALIRQLASSDPKESCDAAIELRSYGPEAVVAVPQLIKTIGNEDGNFKKQYNPSREAYRTLRTLDKDAVQPLIDSINEKQPNIGSILKLLGQIGDKRALPVLLKIIKNDKLGFQQLAFDTLGEIKDQEVVETLLKWLNEKNHNTEFRENIVRALASSRDNRAVEPLIAILGDKSTPEDLRCLVAAVMCNFNDKNAFEPLVQIYNNPQSDDIKLYFIEALGSTKDARAFEILKKIIQTSTDSLAVRSALMGLGGLGDVRSVELLKHLLQDKAQKEGDLGCVAFALVKTKDESAIACVENYLKEHPAMDIHYRRPMIDSLVMSSNPRAYRNAIAFLLGNDKFCAEETARALSESMSFHASAEDGPTEEGKKLPALNDPDVLKALAQSVKDNKNGIDPGYAIWALEKSGMYDIRRKLAADSASPEDQNIATPENKTSK